MHDHLARNHGCKLGLVIDLDTRIGCGLCAWACPYGAREIDAAGGVTKKCTLRVDRIYIKNLPEEDRVPACVRTCSAGARHYGDLGNSDSDVSRLVAARGGVDLMPERGTRPVNQYLSPLPRDGLDAADGAPLREPAAAEQEGFLGWLDRVRGGRVRLFRAPERSPLAGFWRRRSSSGIPNGRGRCSATGDRAGAS